MGIREWEWNKTKTKNQDKNKADFDGEIYEERINNRR